MLRVIARLIVTMAAAALAAVRPSPAAAGPLEIAPTTIELPAGTNTAVLYLRNEGAEPVSIQVEGFDWQQADDADCLDPSDTLLASPPMARIAPGQRQTIRLMVKPGAGPAPERNFRLLVSELPDPSAMPIHGVRMLTQFSVPVFAGGTPATQARLSWDGVLHGESLSLIARNEGTRHAKLSGLALVTAVDRRIEVAPRSFNYILGGASHSWKITQAKIATGETLRIEGNDESAGAPIEGTLVVHR